MPLKYAGVDLSPELCPDTPADLLATLMSRLTRSVTRSEGCPRLEATPPGLHPIQKHPLYVLSRSCHGGLHPHSGVVHLNKPELTREVVVGVWKCHLLSYPNYEQAPRAAMSVHAPWLYIAQCCGGTAYDWCPPVIHTLYPCMVRQQLNILR